MVDVSLPLPSVDYPLAGEDRNCGQRGRHPTVAWSPYDVAAATGAKYKIIHQREGDMLILHPLSYHGGVNIGVTINLASNFSTADMPFVYPYACDCGSRNEPDQSWGPRMKRGKEVPLDPAVKASVERLRDNWSEGVPERLQSGTGPRS